MQHLQYEIKPPLKFAIVLPLLPLKGFLKHVSLVMCLFIAPPHHVPPATVHTSDVALVTDYVCIINANIQMN